MASRDQAAQGPGANRARERGGAARRALRLPIYYSRGPIYYSSWPIYYSSGRGVATGGRPQLIYYSRGPIYYSSG